jgi:hypothetical protein
MSLHAYNVPRLTVTDANGAPLADVRGLNFKDMTIFVNRNFGDLSRITSAWDHYQELTQREDLGAVLSDGLMVEFVADIVMNAPGLIVDIIAMAADATEDADLEAINQWPAHAQVSAVREIYALTVVDFGGPKKLLAAALTQLKNFAPTMTLEA